MSNMVFEFDIEGLRELMKSDEMKGILAEAGSNVAGKASAMAAGEPYNYRVHDASYVSIVNVYPDSPQASKDNLDNNTVLKALQASGYSMEK